MVWRQHDPVASASGPPQTPAVSAASRLDELRATLALAWPLILSNLTMGLIQATDVMWLGRLGPTQLAAAALGLNLAFALNLLCVGLVAASSPMIATEMGARRHSVRDVRRTFRQSLWLVASITVPVWLLLWNGADVIALLGQDPELAREAGHFLRGYMWSFLPFLAFQAMRNFISALERPGWILTISLIGIPANALLGWGLIFGRLGLPRLGIFGGGLATSITWSGLALGLALVILLDRQFRRYHLFGRWWRADWPRYRQLWRLGLPIGLAMGFEGGVFSIAAYLMGLIGADSLAAHAIALQIASVSFTIPLGISQAATVRVGRALGRGDAGGVARAGWTAWLLAVGVMALMAVLLWSAPRALVTIFLADTPANASVIALAISFLGVAAIFQVVDGAQVVGGGMLRGLHDTRVPMLYALLGYGVIGLGVAAWLAFGLQWRGVGVWSGLAAGLASVAVLMVARWARREELGLLSSR